MTDRDFLELLALYVTSTSDEKPAIENRIHREFIARRTGTSQEVIEVRAALQCGLLDAKRIYDAAGCDVELAKAKGLELIRR